MPWFQSIDVALFRFVNQSLSNPLFDRIMPSFAGNSFFVPALIILAVGLIWKGGRRGRILVFLILLAVAIGDGVVSNSIKHAVDRPRPFNDIADAKVLLGKGGSGSMP